MRPRTAQPSGCTVGLIAAWMTSTVGQSDPDLTSARIEGDALEGMREKGGIEMGAQNRLQLLDY
jgi:hypothetical protein